jgi:hypothetical protein
MIKTVVDSFGQLNCGQPAQQLSNICRIVQFPLLLVAERVPKSKMLNSQHQATFILITLCTFVFT